MSFPMGFSINFYEFSALGYVINALDAKVLYLFIGRPHLF